MSAPCPYRHVSYPRWRLQVLKALCASSIPKKEADSPLFYLDLRRRTRSGTRLFSTSPARSNSSEDGQDPGHHGAKDVAASSSNSSPPAVLATETSEYKSRRRPPKRKFSPFSQEGREKLRSAVKGLQAIKSNAEELSPNIRRIQVEFRAFQYDLPESPVTRRSRVERRHKRQPTEEEMDIYANNPWAKMLASSIRYCRATNVRLPAKLMPSWELTRHPTSADVYLLPKELADLKSLEVSTTQSTDHAEEEGEVGSPDMRRDPSAKGDDVGKVSAQLPASAEEDEPTRITFSKPAKPAEPGPPQLSKVRMLPNRTVLSYLTDQVTVSKQGKRVTKLGAMAPYIPHRWKDQFDSIKHYERSRQQVDAAISKVDKTRIIPFEAGFDINKDLKWQPDIHLRVPEMMKSRVLAALEAVAIEASADSRMEQLPVITSIAVPTNGRLILGGDDFVSVAPDIDAPQPAQSDETHHETPDWVPGSIFVHVGQTSINELLPTSSLRSPVRPPDTPTDDYLPALSTHALIPPMLTVNNTHRIPIFSLSTLLDANASTNNNDSSSTLITNLIRKYDILQAPPRSPPSIQTSTSEHETKTKAGEKDYLLHVRSNTKRTQQLVFEIWQLWRYIGGNGEDIDMLDD